MIIETFTALIKRSQLFSPYHMIDHPSCENMDEEDNIVL